MSAYIKKNIPRCLFFVILAAQIVCHPAAGVSQEARAIDRKTHHMATSPTSSVETPPWDVPTEPQGPAVNQDEEDDDYPILILIDGATKKCTFVDYEIALQEGNINNAIISQFYFRDEHGAILEDTPISFTLFYTDFETYIGTSGKTIRSYNFSRSANRLYPGKYLAQTSYTPDALGHARQYYDADNNVQVYFSFSPSGISETSNKLYIWQHPPDERRVEVSVGAHSAFRSIILPTTIKVYAPTPVYSQGEIDSTYSSALRVRYPTEITPYLFTLEFNDPSGHPQEPVPHLVYEKNSNKIIRLIKEKNMPHSDVEPPHWYKTGNYANGYAWSDRVRGWGCSQSTPEEAYQNALASIERKSWCCGYGNFFDRQIVCNAGWWPKCDGEHPGWGVCVDFMRDISESVTYDMGGVSLKDRSTFETDTFIRSQASYTPGLLPPLPAHLYWAESLDALKSEQGENLGSIAESPAFTTFNVTNVIGNRTGLSAIVAGGPDGVGLWNGGNPPFPESYPGVYIDTNSSGSAGYNTVIQYNFAGAYVSANSGSWGGRIHSGWEALYQYKRDDKEIQIGSSSLEAIEYSVSKNQVFKGRSGYFDYAGLGEQAGLIGLVGPFKYDSNFAGSNLYGAFSLVEFRDAPFFPSFTLNYNSMAPWSMVFNAVGRGWSHSYDMFITFERGFRTPLENRLFLKREDGGITHYEKRAGENFFTPILDGNETASDNGARIYKNADRSVRLLRGDGTTYYFNRWGRLTAIEDPFKNKITLTYDQQRLVSIEDFLGRYIRLEYEADDMVKKIVTPSQTFELAHIRPTYLTAMRNQSTQEAISFEYTTDQVENGQDELIQSYTNIDGVRYQFEYSGYREIKKVTDPAGKTLEIDLASKEFKDWNDEVWIKTGFYQKDPLGYEHFWSFGDYDNLETETDEKGRVTTYTYTEYGDSHAKLLTMIFYPSVDGQAISEAFTYYDESEFHWLNTHTDPEGKMVTYTRNLTNGNIDSMVDGEGKIWNYTYKPSGKVESMKDPNKHVTLYDYDTWGYLKSIDPPGPTPATTFENNIMGLPKWKKDALGNYTYYCYDGALRVTDVWVDRDVTPFSDPCQR